MHHIRPVFLKLALIAGLLLWASLSVTPASADSVKFEFAGKVTSFTTVSSGAQFVGSLYSFDVNSPVTGSYTFESSTVGSSGSFTTYDGAITHLTLNVGTLSYGGAVGLGDNSPANSIVVTNNNLFQPGEYYDVRAGFLGTTLNPLHEGFFFLNLDGGTGGVIDSSNSLPTTPPSLNSFASHSVGFLYNGQRFLADGVTANLDSLTLAPVPLPPAVILFGAGLVALVGLGARNWRQKGNSLA